MKKAVYVMMYSLLCVCWTGCTPKDNQAGQSTTASENSKEYLFSFEEIEQFTLEKEGQLAEFELNQANWGLKAGGETLIDQEQVNDKITKLLKTAGKADNTFKLDQGTELFKIITSKESVSFYKEKDAYYGVIGQDSYRLANFDAMSDLSPIYFIGEPLFAEAEEELSKVSFSTDTKTYFMTKDKGTLSDVETTPFISGWYLHNYFKSPRSVEYYTMEQILTNAVLLPSQKINSIPEGSEKFMPVNVTFEYHDGDNRQFSIVAYSEAAQSYFIEHESDIFEVPKNLASVFVKEGLQLVDRFLYILPLDAVTTIDIQQTEGKNFQILLEHEVTSSASASTFYLNEQEVNEDVFRKMYQYIAVLAPLEEIFPSKETLKEAALSLKITYTFIDEGETQTRTLVFYDTGEKDTYLCELENKEFYSVSKQQLEDMLHEIQKIAGD